MESKQEVFNVWKSNIDFRISEWSIDIGNKDILPLDFSKESLNRIEKYLINIYTSESLQQKEHFKELDAIVSYIGETIKNLIIESVWKLYDDDISNVVYNLPCIKTRYSGPISVPPG